MISKGSFVQTKHLCVLIHTCTKGEVGALLNRFLCPPVKYFTDRSKVVLLLWIIHVVSVLFCCAVMHVFIFDALQSPAGKGPTSWLSFVLSYCDVATFPLVSCVRCGT